MTPISRLLQFLRYGIAGAIATVVHVCLFYLLAWKVFPALHSGDPVVTLLGLTVSPVSVTTRSLNSMVCNGMAFIFSNMVAYLINIAWVFETGRHHRLVEIFLFYLVSGLSVFIGTIVMGAMIRYMGVHTSTAFLVNIIISLMLNFGFRKFYIFKG